MIEMYLRLGLAIFPCHTAHINGAARCSCGDPKCANPAKHPVGHLAPNGFKSATKEPKAIRRWDGRGYNVAIATGAVSGIVVADVDPRHSGDQTLAELEAEYGSLPDTWRARSGDGQHVYFRHPGRFVACGEGVIGVGIDIRGDGGYIIAPPSRHITGRTYTWDVDRHPEHTALADTPEWLLAKAAVTDKPKVDWKRFAEAPVLEGERHKAIRSLAGLLFYRLSREPHLAAQLLIAFNDRRCQPPLPEDELARIIDHAAAREIQRRRAVS
jgi:putative DNA primase/helicase